MIYHLSLSLKISNKIYLLFILLIDIIYTIVFKYHFIHFIFKLRVSLHDEKSTFQLFRIVYLFGCIKFKK